MLSETKNYDHWHSWASKNWPLKDRKCDICGEKPATQHACANHDYTDCSTENVICSCHACHRQYDIEHNLTSAIRSLNKYNIIDIQNGEVVAIVGTATKYYSTSRKRPLRVVPKEWDGYDVRVSLENNRNDSIIELARPISRNTPGTIVYLRNEWASKQVYCERLGKSKNSPCSWGGARI